MSDYSVLARPEDVSGADAIFIREGFSWGAFLFTGFWALFRQHYVLAGLLFLCLLLIEKIVAQMNQPELWSVPVQLAFGIFLGGFAAPLRKFFLAMRGFQKIGQVSADNLDDAELRYYANRPAPTSVLTTPPNASDMLGLFAVGHQS